jgi:general secretion pathway protein E
MSSNKEITQVTQIMTVADRERLRESFFEKNLRFESPQELDLGALLIKLGMIDEFKLQEALGIQESEGSTRRLGEILIELKAITEAQLLEILAKQMGLPFVKAINDREIPEELIKKLPTRFARKFGVLPIGYRGEAVVVVTGDPLNTAIIDDVRMMLERPVIIAASPMSVITEAINRSYDRASTADQAMEDISSNVIDDTALNEPVDLLDTEDEAPIIRLVNSLLFRAVKDRASDIHVEPYEKEVAVRFRIDGNLYDIMKIPKRLQNSVGSRIKLLGALNIAEKRLPQDGRIRIKIAGKDIDLRLSTVPTAHGERLVMRLLDKSSVVLELSALGFDPVMMKTMEELITKPFGIILVTGPTGSGKTTTLYACLSQINREDINIITVEDPIEYQLPGIGQIQVNEKVGLTFANGLRSILRQDPDVILIGEIRDRETAEIAVQASLTGHLVLSSIHTNDACSSISRLVDMGVEPFLVSTSLIGIVAQRLVRRVCQSCRQPHQATADQLSRLGIDKIPSQATIYKAVGCSACFHTGYSGRIGIYELLPIDEELRSIILKTPDAVNLRQAAIARGFKPMRYDGLRKILQGQTTIEEVLSTTQEDSRLESLS